MRTDFSVMADAPPPLSASGAAAFQFLDTIEVESTLSAIELQAFRRLDEIEERLTLDDDQRRAFAKAERGESFFLTGKAGTGNGDLRHGTYQFHIGYHFRDK